ncbi:MAG: ATP-binding protein [Candidatus Brocadiales bacterium]|nr:ATP-binding protein [Candidatus Brocadiales bacterium]
MSSFDLVKNKYKTLRFNSISSSLDILVKRAEDNEQTYLQFAEMLVDHELGIREYNRVQLNMRRAGFPVIKHLAEFDFTFQTTITKKQITRLLDYRFIENRENIVFIGPPGVGKTHLSTALGIKAVDAGYKVFFATAQALIESLDLAEMKGELKKKINVIQKFDLLIIDELGYLPLNKKSVFNFFQLINSLYEFRSIILTTNKEFTNWGDFFINENVAVPVVDRIIHRSHIFMMGGDSYRLKEKLKEN